ncbi:MAG: hypothetical protein L3J56_10345 [Bacteroidales bacterium]|nr:hypothetical protein [Bacteroidales bacterium]
MKKTFGLIIIAIFLFACNPKNENGNKTSSDDTTEIVNNNQKNDTTEIVITPAEENQKSSEILQKTEDINNQLDSILNN